MTEVDNIISLKRKIKEQRRQIRGLNKENARLSRISALIQDREELNRIKNYKREMELLSRAIGAEEALKDRKPSAWRKFRDRFTEYVDTCRHEWVCEVYREGSINRYHCNKCDSILLS